MLKKNCIFIGNGLNKCSSNQIGWANLLETVANRYGVTHNSGISLPLEFERLANSILDSSPYRLKDGKEIYKELKKGIIEQIGYNMLIPDGLHKRVAQIMPDVIMTSNYDLMLEKAFQNDIPALATTGTKYLFEPTSHIENTTFYHVHGIESRDTTLCLGYGHYAGLLQHLREVINKTPRGDNSSEKMPKRMQIIRKLQGEAESNGWGDLFYSSNIYFVGFGLDLCEIDLWWLLTHRAYLYYTDYEGVGKKLIDNKIVYYEVIEDNNRSSVELSPKHELLEKLHVEVKCVRSYDYREGYYQILDDIDERINGVNAYRQHNII